MEEVGDPEEVEPPDGVEEKFSGDEGPGLAVGEELCPFDAPGGLLRVALDVGEFLGGEARVFGGFAIEQEPRG